MDQKEFLCKQIAALTRLAAFGKRDVPVDWYGDKMSIAMTAAACEIHGWTTECPEKVKSLFADWGDNYPINLIKCEGGKKRSLIAPALEHVMFLARNTIRHERRKDLTWLKRHPQRDELLDKDEEIEGAVQTSLLHAKADVGGASLARLLNLPTDPEAFIKLMIDDQLDQKNSSQEACQVQRGRNCGGSGYLARLGE